MSSLQCGGRAAYEAYRGETGIPWKQLDLDERIRWESVAQMVIKAIAPKLFSENSTKDPLGDDQED
jgi:hypothetical protein